jgi:hypothetical protein
MLLHRLLWGLWTMGDAMRFFSWTPFWCNLLSSTPLYLHFELFWDKTYGGYITWWFSTLIPRKGHPSKYIYNWVLLIHVEKYALKVRSTQISFSIVYHQCSNLEASLALLIVDSSTIWYVHGSPHWFYVTSSCNFMILGFNFNYYYYIYCYYYLILFYMFTSLNYSSYTEYYKKKTFTFITIYTISYIYSTIHI